MPDPNNPISSTGTGDKNEQSSQQPEPKYFSYFGLKMDGATDSTIHADQKPNYHVILPTRENTWNKYGTKGIQEKKWKDQNDFNQQYDKVESDFNNFRKAQNIHNKAKSATQDTLKNNEYFDTGKLFLPYRAPIRDIGKGRIVSASGAVVRVDTNQQLAYNRGYYIDDTTGGKGDPSELGFGDNIYIAQDKDGNPELHKGDMAKRLKEGQAVSWFGPQMMHSDWASSLLHAVGNGIFSIPAMVGGITRTASDFSTAMYNLATKGKWESSATAIDSLSNMMENFSTHLSRSAESDNENFMYNTVNLVASLAAMGEIGKGVGMASKTLGSK